MPSVTVKLQKFDQDKGWYYVSVPKRLSEKYERVMSRGLVPIVATVKNADWQTSLLPYGDGTHFIAVPHKITSRFDLEVGDTVEVHFEPR